MSQNRMTEHTSLCDVERSGGELRDCASVVRSSRTSRMEIAVHCMHECSGVAVQPNVQ